MSLSQYALFKDFAGVLNHLQSVTKIHVRANSIVRFESSKPTEIAANVDLSQASVFLSDIVKL